MPKNKKKQQNMQLQRSLERWRLACIIAVILAVLLALALAVRGDAAAVVVAVANGIDVAGRVQKMLRL